MKQAIQLAKDHPYALFLLAFVGTIGYGLVKLAAMLQTMQG